MTTDSAPMRQFEKLNLLGCAVVAPATFALAAAWPETRSPMLALGVAAVAQLPIWVHGPSRWTGKPPLWLVALEAVLAAGAVTGSILASPWFALSSVTTLMAAVGLVWARVAPASEPREAKTEAPPAARSTGGVTVEEYRALLPGFDRLGNAVMTFCVITAFLSLPVAFLDPHVMILTAVLLGFAGTARFAEWFSAKSMTPAQRNVLERRRREREAQRAEPSRRR